MGGGILRNTNKNKGFTLIELLAVIVILAIIALIATPIILNMINHAKKSAAKDSAYGYIEAIEQNNALSQMNSTKYKKIEDGTYQGFELLTNLKIRGSVPDYIEYTIEKGKVKEAYMCINNISVEYKDSKATVNGDYCKFATVKKITIKNKVDTIKSGESIELEIEVDPADITPIITSSKDIVKIEGKKITAIKEGNTTITVKAGQKIDSFELTIIKEAGLLEYIEQNKFQNNTYKTISINNINYNVHIYNYEGNQIWTTNQKFGDENDVATETEYAKNMVIVKVNGDLTINENVKVEPFFTEYGGPKGFLLYVTGNLINNGTIDNSHGAKAVGENVYLFKNSDGNFEYIPATGAEGASSVSGEDSHKGLAGENGTGRATAGGGSGGYYGDKGQGKNGSGAAGTSYSGGSGGGAGGRDTAEDAYNNGGKGGDAKGLDNEQYNGGGAGNPGGKPSYRYSIQGENGTGGLLVIYANNITNTGHITANGSKGGYGNDSSGGSSGGGSINIFCGNNCQLNGTISANGGESTTYRNEGGAGGNGSITIGYIKNNTYIPKS